MRVVLFLFLFAVLASTAAQAQGTSPQSYTPPTYTPQTWSPQTHSPPTHSPQTWSPKTGDTQSQKISRRRLVKCMLSSDRDDYCTFYSDRELRPGSQCSCDGSRGSTN
jgi:hypothetical protein